MKRISKAAMLAAILAFSGSSQAQTNSTSRSRMLEDGLTTQVEPLAHRMSDPSEQGYVGLDYTQESRLNDRQRDAMRNKARARKELCRSS